MLVCIGSCLIVIVSAYGFHDVLSDRNVVLDPSRIAAQVVSGVGFLGAGTILFRGEAVKGLTTAASLWAVAGIGLAAGSGLYVAAVASTVVILTVLAGLKPIEERYRSRLQTRTLVVLAERDRFTLDKLKEAAGPSARRIQQFVLKQTATEDVDEAEVAFARLPEAALRDIADKIRALPGIRQVESPDLG